MTWPDVLARFGVAVLTGLLVGIEREQRQARSEALRFGGVRTFMLLALLGALGGFLRTEVGPFLPAVLLVFVAASVIGFTVIATRMAPASGYATMIAGFIVHVLGFAATTPVAGLDEASRLGLVATLGVFTMAILSMEEPLHALAGRLDSDDFYATGKLAALLLVVLPLLPNAQVGPVQPFNPFEVGKFVAIVAAIGFVGYVAVRIVGIQRGMLLVAGVGGLASSTAVTLDFSRRAKADPGLVIPAAMGIGLASSIMFVRMLVEVAVVAPGLLLPAARTLGLMGATGFLAIAIAWAANRKEPRGEAGEIGFRNPFALGEALRFGLVYIAISLVTFHVAARFGNAGLLASAVFSGIADVDAITLTLARGWASGDTPTGTALTGLVLAAGSNTVVKATLCIVLGSWQLGYRVMGIFAAVLVVGGVSMALSAF